MYIYILYNTSKPESPKPLNFEILHKSKSRSLSPPCSPKTIKPYKLATIAGHSCQRPSSARRQMIPSRSLKLGLRVELRGSSRRLPRKSARIQAMTE